MIPITITEFVKHTVEANPDTDAETLTAACHETLKAKHSGAICMICSSPIWAAGSAITGTYMCFACMTGEMDDSEDYEIEEGVSDERTYD